MNPIFLLAIKISKCQRVTSKESAPLSTLLCWLRVCLNRIYFVETENWKYCSKIIFKCVNSTVGPIFNEKIDKKWNLWVREQCINVLFMEDRSKVAATVHVPYINSTTCWEKGVKKKKEKRKTQKLKTRQTWIQTVPNNQKLYFFFLRAKNQKLQWTKKKKTKKWEGIKVKLP